MNKHIFIINGSGGSGKDTFVSLAAKHYPTMNYSSVDKVKEIATQIGWNGSKTERDRKFLSDLKLLTTTYCDMPFKDLQEKVDEFNQDDKLMYLFLHIREPEEIEKAKKNFNAKTILVRRNSINKITSNMADANVENYHYDYYINNDSTLSDFERKAVNFIEMIEKESRQKKKLFIDMDCTLFDTVKCICDLYNEDFSAYPKYKFVHPSQINTYDFEELSLVKKEYINTYFNQPRFFERVEFMDNAEEVIENLKTKYDITFVSMGQAPNIKLKRKWIEEHISDVNFIGVDFEWFPDKKNVDMSGGILLDDSLEMLDSSNASRKICFGDYYEWNSKSDTPYLRLMNWKDVERYLMKDDVGGDL